jgi:hypothetical protein
MGAHWEATDLDFNGQQMQGLGPLNYEAQRCRLLHPTHVHDTPASAPGHHERLDVGKRV